MRAAERTTAPEKRITPLEDGIYLTYTGRKMDVDDLLENCEQFEWDKGNWDKNWRTHRVAPYECEQVFFNRPLVLQQHASRSVERRYYVLGQTDEGRWLFIVFVVRARHMRIISARDMTNKERKHYESL